MLEPSRLGATADTAGRFQFDSVPAGVYRLMLRGLGYHQRGVDSVRVTTSAGSRVVVSSQVGGARRVWIRGRRQAEALVEMVVSGPPNEAFQMTGRPAS